MSSKAGRIIFWVAVVLLAGIAGLSGLLAANWPFTPEAMTKRLERASSARVEMHGFRSTYFPYPGCVAEDVVFRKPVAAGSPGAPQQPIITIHELKIQSTFLGLFLKPTRIKMLVADGLRIHVPPGGVTLASQTSSDRDQTIIEEVRADDAVLEIASRQGQQPLAFRIHHALFRSVSAQITIPFQLSLHLPIPPGEVESSGWIGPWKDAKGTVRGTPISGSYALREANLGVFPALTGKVSSRGEFAGTLDRLNVTGSTDSPDFEVTKSGHRFHLGTQFRGILDLKTGDVTLPFLQARLGNTALLAHAAVSGDPKTVRLNVTQGMGEIQDLILLFSKAPHSPVTGPVTFHTQVLLPPEHRPFKKRVQLSGNFNVNPARFTSSNTQGNVDQLSERASGKKDKEQDHEADDAAGFERVLTSLKGRVELRNGVATFSQVSFFVPGAWADMKGTYNLEDKRVNLRGKMRMQATVSQATTGAKSFFLKVLDPFFKKKGAGAEVPVTMTGTYGHTHFTAGLK